MCKNATIVMLLSSCAALVACSETADPASITKIESFDTTFESRGVQVPATVVLPNMSDDSLVPLVVMAHGHGGSRQEAGGYKMAAEAMAERGIASIRMDFPGCGDSTESFAKNNISNMLLDLQEARLFAESELQVDAERVGLLGYSMGGRLVALLSEIDPSYRAMVAWAPSVLDGATRERRLTFGGPEQYEFHKQRAQAEGSSVYTTMWGTELELGPRWFRDIEESRPQAALAKFAGPLLVIYGDADEAVAPEIAASAVSAAVNSSDVVELKIAGAGHALGIYTNRPEITLQVVETSADFLAENL